jgi:polysaccharide biosynthesis transport protein
MKRWWWIIALGLVLGALAGYLYSSNQQPVYQASAKVMFIQQQMNMESGLSYLNDKNMARTLSELILARPVASEAANRIGYSFNRNRMIAQQVGETNVIEIRITDADPENSAEIVNAVVAVFIEQQSELRSSLYASSQESMSAQIDQIRDQMDALQSESIQEVRQMHAQQVRNLERTLADLRLEVNTLQNDLVMLQFSGTPVAGYDENRRWTRVLPTPTIEQRIEIADKTNRLRQAQNLISLYERVYVDLSVSQDSPQAVGSLPDEAAITLAQYQEIYKNLLQNYEAIRLASLQSTPDLVLVETATPPEQPIFPNPPLFTAIGGLLGLLLGMGVAYGLVSFDDIFRTADEVRALVPVPVLAYVKNLRSGRGPAGSALPPPQPVSTDNLYSQPSARHISSNDGLRFLRANLEVIHSEDPIHSLLVASPADPTTAAMLAVQLARMYAQGGRRVLLIESDLRSPKLAQLMGLNGQLGLGEVLTGGATIQEVTTQVDDDCLSVITAGQLQNTPADLLDRSSFRQVLDTLDLDVGMVIITAPPFAFAEASAVASTVDGVLIAIELDRTRASTTLASLDQLALVRARVVGTVLL